MGYSAMFILTLLLACSGCVSCQPELPLDNNTEPSDENQPSDEDSGEDTAEDTGPAPLCPLTEEEPNGSYDDAISADFGAGTGVD